MFYVKPSTNGSNTYNAAMKNYSSSCLFSFLQLIRHFASHLPLLAPSSCSRAYTILHTNVRMYSIHVDCNHPSWHVFVLICCFIPSAWLTQCILHILVSKNCSMHITTTSICNQAAENIRRAHQLNRMVI